MRTRFLVYALFLLFALPGSMRAEEIASGYDVGFDFAEVNDAGDTIYYLFPDEYHTNPACSSVLIGEMANKETPFITDSLVIPNRVKHNGIEYVVTGMVFCSFLHIPNHVQSITLPASFVDLDTTMAVSGFAYSSFQSIYCDESNPSFESIKGILYSKDKCALVAYPPQRKDSIVIVDDGIKHLGYNVFNCSPFIKKIILPNSLRTIGYRAFFTLDSLRELTLQDSVQVIGKGAFTKTPLVKLTMGSQISEVDYTFLSRGVEHPVNDSIAVYCHTLIPPKVNFRESTSTTFVDNEYIHLFVPRAALTAYQRAAGWKDCASILPIEPPIVVGKDEAEVSWVQNFSATGYVWTLYMDEAKTKRFMSLTFDANGHLTRIDINSNSAPERMMPLDDEEEEKRFAEYYSFTITGLSPQTQYFYTRQSLKGTEVIDEETGSFTTDSPSNLHDINANGLTNKILHEGHLLINHNGHLHTATGARVK